VERNARQYCPAANRDWALRIPEAFRLRDGKIDTSRLGGAGLGFY
jgi:hypothetical protein